MLYQVLRQVLDQVFHHPPTRTCHRGNAGVAGLRPRTAELRGGGVKTLCVLQPLCVDLDLGPQQFFSCIWTP